MPLSSQAARQSIAGEQPTIYADLVKIDTNTLEAINEIAATLNLAPQQIGYAGIKDKRALTSQRISIRTKGRAPIPNVTHPRIFLKPQKSGKGAVSIGQLKGNRFTILVRTSEPSDQAKLAAEAASLGENGFPNFYGPQRFGNRQLNPLFGKLLCQGDYADAIRAFLTETGTFDIPIHAIVRTKAAQYFGQWQKMADTFRILPYTFQNECRVLESLLQNPDNWLQALFAIRDQVRLWVYGYNSFLVNRVLSETYQGKRDLPDPLPLPLGGRDSDDLYQADLKRDNTLGYAENLRPLRFLVQKFRTIKPWITPNVHHVKVVEPGAILSFSLPKGVYATTFLMFLFQIYEGLPAPTWVKTEIVDLKAQLSTGSVQAALDKLGYTLEQSFTK